MVHRSDLWCAIDRFWNKLCLQPIDEQNFGYKRFLSTSHHAIVTVKYLLFSQSLGFKSFPFAGE
jgi:hypothetical protein